MADIDTDSDAGTSTDPVHVADEPDAVDVVDRERTAHSDGGDPVEHVDRHGAAPVPAPALTRRGRIRKWDRPPPPHDWRWGVSHLGRILITIGLLMFGFVGYQLWGTGIETARAQNALENDFEALLAEVEPVEGDVTVVEVDDPVLSTPASTVAPADETDGAAADEVAADPGADTAAGLIPVEEQNIPELENGDALARIEIPSIGVNDIVVAGVETSDLKKGPGHFPDTPLPGQLGNSAIAGHRTTYGQPFHNVDKLEPGDEIRVTTLNGIYVYRVTGQQIVSPSDYQVIATTDPTTANLTLTSCHPKWTAQQRIIIFSELDRTESAPVGEPVYNYGRIIETVDDIEPADTLPAESADAPSSDETGDPDGTAGDVEDDAGTETDDTEVVGDADEDTAAVSGSVTDNDTPPAEATPTTQNSAGIADAFAEGWFSDPGANLQVGLWGTLLAAIGIGAYLISRRLRRDWVGGLLGIMPFVVALYFFFQNVNRLLPPNL